MNPALYRLVRWWLGVLSVDDAGRRIFDETLADWRKEAAKANGAATSTLVTARAMFAVIRCVAGVSVREAGAIHRSGVLPRAVLLVAAYLALVNLLAFATPSPWQISPISLVYAQLPFAVFFLPVALLLAASFGGQRRPLPSLGLGLSACMVAVAILGWGVPLANRAFLEANPGTAVSGGQSQIVPNKPGTGLAIAMGGWRRNGVAYLPPGVFMNDVTIRQLAAKIAGGPESGGWSAIRWMSFFFAYLATCALVPVLASLLRRTNILIRVAIAVVTVPLLWMQGGLATPFTEFSFVWWLGAFWIPVAWIGLCAVGLGPLSETGAKGAATSCDAFKLQIANNK